MKKTTPHRVAPPFCRGPWNIGAILLVVGFIGTVIWGFQLLHHVEDDLEELQHENASVQTVALTPVAFSPIQVALVNIAGITKATAKQPSQFLSTGSGVLITPTGYVATALHVIEGLQDILVRVQTPSGPRQYSAQLVKSSQTHGLAVIKLVSRDLFPYAPLALDTSRLTVNDTVIAWGNSDGSNAFSRSGRVFETQASTRIEGQWLTHLIRTDAVSHWSQSGGPLVAPDGRVVGINIAAQGGAGGVVGLAIPSDVLLAHFQDVVTFPAVSTPPVNVPLPVLGGQTGNQTGANPVVFQRGNGQGRNGRVADAYWARVEKPTVPNTIAGSPQAQSAAPFQGLGLYAASTNQVPHSPSEWRFWGYDIQTLLGLLLLGLLSGISGGMMTMGGGIIKVTGLIIFFGYGMLLIRPVAYVTNIFLYGAAVLRYRRYGLIRWETTRYLIPWAMVGVIMGYFLGNGLGFQFIHYLLGVFAAFVGIKMLVEIVEHHQQTKLVLPWSEDDASKKSTNLFLRYLGVGQLSEGERPNIESAAARHGLLGLPMGIISGILGITGGVIEVPLQRCVLGVPLRSAIANSAVLVFFASTTGSIVAMAYGIQTGAFEWSAPLRLALVLIPGAYVGGLIGAWLTKIVPLGTLRWIYAVFMFVIAGRMLMG